MADQLRQAGVMVLYQAPSQHAVREAGVMVLYEAQPHHLVREAGVMVLFQAQGDAHRARFTGVSVLYAAEEAPPPSGTFHQSVGFLLVSDTPPPSGQFQQAVAFVVVSDVPVVPEPEPPPPPPRAVRRAAVAPFLLNPRRSKPI